MLDPLIPMLLWSITAMIFSCVTINYGRILLPVLDEHRKYEANKDIAQDRLRRERAERIRLEAQALEDLMWKGTIPLHIQVHREWAIKELVSMSPTDMRVVKEGSKIVKQGRVLGLEIRLNSSGKSYDYDHWQALCVYCPELTKEDLINHRARPIEVSPFDEPRME